MFMEALLVLIIVFVLVGQYDRWSAFKAANIEGVVVYVLAAMILTGIVMVILSAMGLVSPY